MNGLEAVITAVERREKTLEVYDEAGTVAPELASQFETRNVRVVSRPLPPGDEQGFVVIRDADGQFQGALSVENLRAIASPAIHPPWTLGETETDYGEVFEFLENTLFTSYDRRQMLATTREIEERAWRVGAGSLYVGFQNADRFASQRRTYSRLARETRLSIRVFVEDKWERPVDVGIEVVTGGRGEEIGRFWFVLFDGNGSELNACGLLAEEREPGSFYGFWTYDAVRVAELISYLESTYGGSRDDRLQAA